MIEHVFRVGSKRLTGTHHHKINSVTFLDFSTKKAVSESPKKKFKVTTSNRYQCFGAEVSRMFCCSLWFRRTFCHRLSFCRETLHSKFIPLSDLD